MEQTMLLLKIHDATAKPEW